VLTFSHFDNVSSPRESAAVSKSVCAPRDYFVIPRVRGVTRAFFVSPPNLLTNEMTNLTRQRRLKNDLNTMEKNETILPRLYMHDTGLWNLDNQIFSSLVHFLYCLNFACAQLFSVMHLGCLWMRRRIYKCIFTQRRRLFSLIGARVAFYRGSHQQEQQQLSAP
jgi:hypothetical protein